jgi:hypothetical protein
MLALTPNPQSPKAVVVVGFTAATWGVMEAAVVAAWVAMDTAWREETWEVMAVAVMTETWEVMAVAARAVAVLCGTDTTLQQ